MTVKKYDREDNVPMPEKRFRPRKMTNYDDLAKRGAEGLRNKLYNTRIQAGRELAKEAKNYIRQKENGKIIYKEYMNDSEQTAQLLARMIGKIYKAQQNK